MAPDESICRERRSLEESGFFDRVDRVLRAARFELAVTVPKIADVFLVESNRSITKGMTLSRLFVLSQRMGRECPCKEYDAREYYCAMRTSAPHERNPLAPEPCQKNRYPTLMPKLNMEILLLSR